MLNEKIHRGSYGYIDYKKKNYGIKALVVALFMLAAAGVGYLIFGTFRNLIMVPTMVLVIPLAMMAASFFALVKFSSAPQNQYAMLKNFDEEGMLLSDLVIVDHRGKRFLLPFVVIGSGELLGFMPSPGNNKNIVSDHINILLKNRGVNMRLTIVEDFDVFTEKINGLQKPDAEKSNISLATETIINTCM